MTNIFIIHGAYGHPGENWFPWLKVELEKKGCKVFIPKFPTPEKQTLPEWMKVLEVYRPQITKDTIFVGHSLGVPFILNLLEKFTVKAAFLVAGFCTLPENQFKEGMRTFVKDFDYAKIKQNCKHFSVYHSNNDPYLPLTLGEELADRLDIDLFLVKGAGHFNESAGYKQFPILLKGIEREI
jgi:predicted alpha/beta hydrolase family esterase